MPAALDGMKVVDLSRTGPGQWVTTTLADLGADVVAVEQPGFLARRTTGSAAAAGFGISIGRNKRSILLNLADERGREIFFRLAEHADVVMESFRPGTAARLGVSYEDVQRINPIVVYCSLSGFGQTGPYARLPAHDIQFAAIGGMLPLDDRGRPAVPRYVWADRQASTNAVTAILAALVARERMGIGQYLDVSFLDPAVTLPGSHLDDMLLGAYPCYRIYECADSRFVALGIREPWFWERFCRFLGKDEWIEHQRPEGALREEMQAFFDAAFRSRPRDEWVQIFLEHDIEGAPVNQGDDILADPQIAEREMVVDVEDAAGGPARQLGSSLKLSRTPWRLDRPFTRLGADTDAVLGELGIDEAWRTTLRADGVIE